MKDVLVIEDDDLSREFLATCITSKGLTVDSSPDWASASAMLDAGKFRLVIADLKLPDGSGVEILKRVKSTHEGTDVIVVTGYGNVETAVECMKLGAYDFLLKPLSKARLESLVERALERQHLLAETATLRRKVASSFSKGSIVAQSDPMRAVMKLISAAADTDSEVLIRGESGTGKELIAREIHSSSNRASGPLVSVSCGALPEGLLESELFGHEKGALPSAQIQKPGRLELADGGIIFLDEVQELSPALQLRLLSVIQNRELQRVGGAENIPLDVRVIGATDRNLERTMQEGLFREDLYYRISVMEIRVPPLRERISDIPVLAESILRDICARAKKSKKSITHQTMEYLIRFPWPGNVRQLENVLERAVVLCKDSEILPKDLPDYLLSAFESPGSKGSGVKTLDQVEKEHIQFALQMCDGNRSKAAKMLGIDRGTLARKLRISKPAAYAGHEDKSRPASS
jgi:DNA-binding NtrC family response regulator